ncbi:MAG: hypothetical protein K2R98_15805 [Gemmataceae bacterium]|nr:hypothetical protein [Gemmataceae bacterium]
MAVDMLIQLIEQLRQSQLLTPPQLDELNRCLQRRFPESKALALAIVERVWLTAYQARGNSCKAALAWCWDRTPFSTGWAKAAAARCSRPAIGP